MAIRSGVIGVGVHGNHHVKVLSSLKNVKLEGIYDRNQEKSNSVAASFGCRSFSSIDELLGSVDCVNIAVPTSDHHRIVMQCLRADIPVLVEKPIARTVQEALEMIQEAADRGLVLSVGHVERFNPAYRAITSLELTPLFIESHRLSVFNPRGTDVAVVFDLMIHDIDIVCDLVKRPVVSVHASGVSVVTDETDIANARIEFEGGCVANLTASRISRQKLRKVRVFQRNSYISMDFLNGESEIFAIDPDIRPTASAGSLPNEIEGIIYKKTPNDGLNALECEITDFLQAVANGRKPGVTGDEGLRALETAVQVMEGIERSIRRIN